MSGNFVFARERSLESPTWVPPPPAAYPQEDQAVPETSSISIEPIECAPSPEDTAFAVVAHEGQGTRQLSHPFFAPRGEIQEWGMGDVDRDGDVDLIIPTNGGALLLPNISAQNEETRSILRRYASLRPGQFGDGRTIEQSIEAAAVLAAAGDAGPLCDYAGLTGANSARAISHLMALGYPECPDWRPTNEVQGQIDVASRVPDKNCDCPTTLRGAYDIPLGRIYPNSEEGRRTLQRLWERFGQLADFQRAFTRLNLLPFLTTEQLIGAHFTEGLEDLSSPDAKKPHQLIAERGISAEQEDYVINCLTGRNSWKAMFLLENLAPSDSARPRLLGIMSRESGEVASRAASVLASWGYETVAVRTYARRAFESRLSWQRQAEGLTILREADMIETRDWPKIISMLDSDSDLLATKARGTLYGLAEERRAEVIPLLTEYLSALLPGARDVLGVLDYWDVSPTTNLVLAVREVLRDGPSMPTRTAALGLVEGWDVSVPDAVDPDFVALNLEREDVNLRNFQLRALVKHWPQDRSLPPDIAERIVGLISNDRHWIEPSALYTALHFRRDPNIRSALNDKTGVLSGIGSGNGPMRSMARFILAMGWMEVSEEALQAFANSTFPDSFVRDIDDFSLQAVIKRFDDRILDIAEHDSGHNWALADRYFSGRPLSEKQTEAFVREVGFSQGQIPEWLLSKWVGRPEVRRFVSEALVHPYNIRAREAGGNSAPWGLVGALVLAGYSNGDAEMEYLVVRSTLGSALEGSAARSAALDAMQRLGTPPNPTAFPILIGRFINWASQERVDPRYGIAPSVGRLLTDWMGTDG